MTRIHVLEEGFRTVGPGHHQMGGRVKAKLKDDHGNVRGEGMTEVSWTR
jgi:hypothetical protein